MKVPQVYLRHILDCIRRINENTAGGMDRFMASHTLQDAVLRNLQILAESTQRLSEDLKAKYPDADWQRISAFRNVLVHNYLGIDMEIIWQITQHDVKQLNDVIERIFEGENFNDQENVGSP